jgi:hypothetical protein
MWIWRVDLGIEYGGKNEKYNILLGATSRHYRIVEDSGISKIPGFTP